MSPAELLPIDRYLWTLGIIYKEGKQLIYSWNQLFGNDKVDQSWVDSLVDAPDEAVQLEAFVSRYGRMQDSMADKLIPRWLQTLAEQPASQIENLNRAERLGVIESTERWLAARKLRNQLIHEYMTDSRLFYEALLSARDASQMLLTSYDSIRSYSIEKSGMSIDGLPPVLLDSP